MISAYRPGTSPIHRLAAGPKMAALAIAGTGLFFVTGLAGTALALAAAITLYFAAGLTLRDVWSVLRPLLIVMVLLVLAHAWLNGWAAAFAMGMRLGALVLLAGLVTLTTPSSAIMAAIETGLQPLSRFGVDVEKISLALSLALRFIPLIASVGAEVREAQRARGLDGSLVALAVPLLVRTLRMGEDIADAIDARGFGSTRR
ncbi:energy-coupling factor transporter transmembrane protein EcfT [Mesorhizobium sp. YIM 152430]|uniref:energy-coupling factor transporter transmembrane component T family protein n=1 Tax=Mesorhizobium sp. YIM 152430 TaxID=3031761 RepID=UPI0023D97EAC|nr:energy-coupling factor transporter transmembrane protein EcfT [Mesorhizobium sp. YIM 152430]MDF1601727.1 energy-coupling factor transporter transmembrane protein EcfT [Mesorhizobium sp. YIM 152430]